ncbi:MAG: DMT family transporter, partial [Proteobacteria bacterium]|nr:DMT family transporter [Pseudomonadota bacterium]
TVILVSGTNGDGGATLIGDSIVFLGAFLACVAILVLRRVAQVHGQPMAVTAFQLAGASFSGVVVVGGIAIFNQDPEPFVAITRIDTQGWLIMLYLGVMVSAAAFFIYNYALGHIEVGRISLYLVLIAPLGVPLAAIFLGETITLRDGFAIVLVMFGVALPYFVSHRWMGRLRGRRIA